VLIARGEVNEAVTVLRGAFALSRSEEYLPAVPWGEIAGLLAGLYERYGRSVEALSWDLVIKNHGALFQWSGAAALRLARMCPSEGDDRLVFCKRLIDYVERRP
jgi:hypothetical protein